MDIVSKKPYTSYMTLIWHLRSVYGLITGFSHRSCYVKCSVVQKIQNFWRHYWLGFFKLKLMIKRIWRYEDFRQIIMTITNSLHIETIVLTSQRLNLMSFAKLCIRWTLLRRQKKTKKRNFSNSFKNIENKHCFHSQWSKFLLHFYLWRQKMIFTIVPLSNDKRFRSQALTRPCKISANYASQRYIFFSFFRSSRH